VIYLLESQQNDVKKLPIQQSVWEQSLTKATKEQLANKNTLETDYGQILSQRFP